MIFSETGLHFSGSCSSSLLRRRRGRKTAYKPAGSVAPQSTATTKRQLLPHLRNGETAQLHDPKIEDKETPPPPRYNEGTLIEAMQNAWRFVDDEVLGSA